MKTPEEIKKALECCIADIDGFANCAECPYKNVEEWGCTTGPMESDVLEYIRQLEKIVDRYKDAFEKTYDRMEEAYRELDGAENCTNCIYGDGTITGTDYCYECRWFGQENNRLKWVGSPKTLQEG